MPEVRILVVDDEPGIRATVSAMLEIEGYDVAEASNGADALAAVEAGPPDVILLDMRMPVLDGLQATEEIMAYHPTPILVLTSSLGRHDGGMTFQLLNAGALEVLEKPKDLATAQSPSMQRFLIWTR